MDIGERIPIAKRIIIIFAVFFIFQNPVLHHHICVMNSLIQAWHKNICNHLFVFFSIPLGISLCSQDPVKIRNKFLGSFLCITLFKVINQPYFKRNIGKSNSDSILFCGFYRRFNRISREFVLIKNAPHSVPSIFHPDSMTNKRNRIVIHKFHADFENTFIIRANCFKIVFLRPLSVGQNQKLIPNRNFLGLSRHMPTSFLAFKVRQRSIEAGKITLTEKIVLTYSVEIGKRHKRASPVLILAGKINLITA